MKASQAIAKLEDAIMNCPVDCGPVSWRVENHGNKVLLIGQYDNNDHTAEMTDEPWREFGGDAILIAAGLEQDNAGVDQCCDKYGDDVIAQWVSIRCEDDTE